MRREFDTPLPTLLSFPLGVLAACCARAAVDSIWWARFALMEDPELATHLAGNGISGQFAVGVGFFGLSAVFLLALSFLGFVRRPWVLPLLRKGYVLSYVLFWFVAHLVFSVTDAFFRCGYDFDGAEVDSVTLFYLRWDLLQGPLLALAFFGWLHVYSLRRATINLYAGESRRDPARGDAILENLRSHGADPQYRKSSWNSAISHVMVLIVIPWLLRMGGCVEPYRVPKGQGEPVVALVQIVQPKKIKKKKYVFNPESAISFYVPDLDDSEVLKEVQEHTELTYKANPNARPGKMGRGGKGKGGWPDGMADGKVRFIRLSYDGVRWDDGMDRNSAADINFLAEFKSLTGFPSAKEGESHPVRHLAKYDDGYAPPFVYLTGDGHIRMNAKDMEILRAYLEGGGMLFADAGSPGFDRSFRPFIQQVMPGHRLVTIADDDPIFQFPYSFRGGAPPLWHHGGNRALGMKYKGRWCVFYHPGDINDAWKTGHSGLRADQAEAAFNMGVNIVYYSFTHYLELTRKHRKK